MDKGRTLLVIIEGISETPIEYPNDLPVPRYKEQILINGHRGIVKNVLHQTYGDVTKIKITCEPFNEKICL